MGRAERQRDREDAPPADLTGRGQLAAVELHELLHEGEADSRALVAPSLRAFHAVEPFEHARQLVFGNAVARVEHGQLNPLILFCNADGDHDRRA